MIAKRWEILDRLAPVILKYAEGNCLTDIGMGYTIDSDVNSTQILAHYAEKFEIPLHSCDINPQFGPLNKFHHIHKMDSSEFVGWWKLYMRPKLVFLDGCHMSDKVRPEVSFFVTAMKPGAVMFCHDMYPAKMEYCHNKPIGTFTGPRCGDGYKVRQDLEKRRDELDIDIFTWPYSPPSHGLTMIIKKEHNRIECRR